MVVSLGQLYWLTLGLSGAGFLAVVRPRLAVPAAFALGALLIYAQAFQFWNLTVDDAYISFRYARNLAHGNGLVWNPGDRVEGYSNFGWVLILAAAERVGLGIVGPARWLGYASSVGVLAMLWPFARRLVPESRRVAALVFCGAAITFAALPSTGYWASAGLEEPLFVLMVLAALYAHVVEDASPSAAPTSALVALAAALLRPEGILLAVVLFLIKAVGCATRRDPQRLRSLLLWGAIVAIPFGSYLGWRFSYYGYFLPNTYYQKVSGGPAFDIARYRDGLSYLGSFWLHEGAVFMLPLPLVELWRRERRRVAVPLVAFGATWSAYVAFVGGDFMSFHRFMSPLVPLALLLSADAICFLTVRAYEQWISPDILGTPVRVLLAALATAMIAWMIVVPSEEVRLLNLRRYQHDSAQQISTWLRTQDPSTYIAIGSAGYIPYETELPALDTLGLNDEHIAHGPRLHDRHDVQGHRKGDGAYVISRKPDVIIVAALVQGHRLSASDWRGRRDSGDLLAAETDLFSQSALWAEYEPVSVELSPDSYFSFFRRIGVEKVRASPVRGP